MTTTTVRGQNRKSVDMIMVDDPWAERLLFDDAIAAVQSAISEEHSKTLRRHARASCLLDSLKEHHNHQNQGGEELDKCLHQLVLFVERFVPYLDLVDACIETSLDLAGWLWGIIGLVFEIGREYAFILVKAMDTLAGISTVLPDYQHLHDQHKHKLHIINDERWRILLSYVYADMMQHCVDLYHIFCRASSGVALRHVRLCPSPTILLWRPLDSRLARLEIRIANYKRWIEAEFACQPEDDATKELHRRKYTEFLTQQAATDNHSSTLEDSRMAKRMRRIDKIKAWLSNDCAYQDVYEHRMRQRHPQTCSWFLEMEEYCAWKNFSFYQGLTSNFDDLEETWHDRVLFVQAKPGFGKSFISGAVIDDLVEEAQNLNIDDENETPSTVFFHFNAAHSYCIHPIDAFRALANQLIHIHRHSRLTLDTVSLLMRKTPSHIRASPDDVVGLLSLLLSQHPTFLVIDGVDECVDFDHFLRTLGEICSKTDTRVILFSRLSVRPELDLGNWAIDPSRVVTLAEGSNRQDIGRFVSETLNRMADKGFFGISMNRDLIPQVAEQSNGVFLWASLVVKYLQSPDLSPDERRVVLEQIHQLEGLESIYEHILKTLDLRPDHEKLAINNILRWLSLSINRLCMPGFQIATAVEYTPSATDPSVLSTFYDSLPQLTCGLVEVTDCSAVFAHRSVKEYLQSPASSTSPFTQHNTAEPESHKHLAARCLSFLANPKPNPPSPNPATSPPSLSPSSHIPPSISRSTDSGYKSSTPSLIFPVHPLSSPPPTTTNSPPLPFHPFDANTPFLRYASLCWPIHLTRALSQQPLPSSYSSSTTHPTSPWLAPLSAFLTSHSAVTAWVEASWRFNLPPNLSRLIPLLEALKAVVPPATVEGRELRWVVKGIRELCGACRELRDGFGTAVGKDPGLVWRWRGRLGGVAGGVAV
ncbi:unnamed protein product [Periconia digitata]|uniref:Nephrocystin 3-like N-terminal domain-containing protein n=1 Tax=Periconia digitata TaxID=1303443 RepID=A0A9W4ULB8_9PLEO|nr:unnamed protein product [Periconia digitata]